MRSEGRASVSLVERINVSVEKSFMSIGRFVSRWPRVLLPLCIAMILLCLGLLKTTTQSDTYTLWIESGSRLLPERAFKDKAFGSVGTRTEYMINEIKDGSASVLSEAHLTEVLASSKILANATYYYSGPANKNIRTGYKWNDVCSRPATPASVLAITNGVYIPGPAAGFLGLNADYSTPYIFAPFELPCTAYTPLDCFSEGDWNYKLPDLRPVPWNASRPNALAAAIALGAYPASAFPANPLPNLYQNRPSFKGMTPTQIGNTIQNSCKQWLGITVPLGFMFGDVKRTQVGACSLNDYTCPVNTVNSVETVWTTMEKETLAIRLCRLYYRVWVPYNPPIVGNDTLGTILCVQNTPAQKFIDAADEIILGWETEFMNVAAMLGESTTHVTVRYLTERSSDDLLDEAAAGDLPLIVASWVLLIVFGGATGWKNDCASSQVCSRLFGCLLICLSTFAGMALSSLFGVDFTPTTYQVLPFLGLGLGAADLFVLADTYRFAMDQDPQESLQECMREAGASITLASATNFFAFLIGSASIPLIGVSTFAQSAALVVLLNWVMNVFGFQSLMVITHQRMRRGYSADCCCVKIVTRPTPCCGSGSQVQQLGSTSAPRIVKIASHGGEIPGEAKAHKCVIWYSEMLAKWPVKIAIICVFLVIFGIAIKGATMTEDGLPLGDIVPSSSYVKPFLTVRLGDYGDYPASIIVGSKAGSSDFDETINWEKSLTSIFASEVALTAVAGVNKVISIYSFSAWDHFIASLNLYQRKWNTTTWSGDAPCTLIPECYDCDVCMGDYYVENTAATYYYPTPFFFALVPALSLQATYITANPWSPWYGYKGNMTRFPTKPVVRYPKSEWIPVLLQAFLGTNLGATDSGSFSYRTTPEANVAGRTGNYYQPKAVQTTFVQTGLYTMDELMDQIRASRAALDPFYPHVYPAGYVYNTNEQYLNSRVYLAKGLAWSTLVVALVCLFFLLSPGATLIMLVNITMTVTTIYGFLYYFDLKVNSVSSINTIMAVGSVVAFNAYTTRAFLIAKGTRNERMKEAIYLMFLPTLWGGIATFLGIVLLGGAKFPYFRLYFFEMYVGIIIFGLGYGLCMLPVVLSIIGPATLTVGSAYSALENKKSPSHANGGGDTTTGGTGGSAVQMTTNDHVSPLKPGELPPPSAEGAKRNAWG